MKVWWFRPPIPCPTEHDLLVNVWDWIGQAYAWDWYPEEDRARRRKEHEARSR